MGGLNHVGAVEELNREVHETNVVLGNHHPCDCIHEKKGFVAGDFMGEDLALTLARKVGYSYGEYKVCREGIAETKGRQLSANCDRLTQRRGQRIDSDAVVVILDLATFGVLAAAGADPVPVTRNDSVDHRNLAAELSTLGLAYVEVIRLRAVADLSYVLLHRRCNA